MVRITPVTDPALLAQLNGTDAPPAMPQQQPVANGQQPVTDPNILAQLNGTSTPDQGTAGDANNGQAMAIRHNNPLNIRPTAQDEPQDGGFRTFQSPQDGLKEGVRQLTVKLNGTSPAMIKAYGQGYKPSIRNVISVWAPPTDNNNTDNYIKTVSKSLGIDPDQPLKPEQAKDLANAMIPIEGGAKAKDYFAPGVMNNIKDDLTGRGQQIQQIQQAANQGQIADNPILNNIGAGAQLAGPVLGAAKDVTGDLINSGVNAAATGINNLSGGRLGKYADKAGSAISNYLANSVDGDQIYNGLNTASDAIKPLVNSALSAYGDYKNDNPNASRYLDVLGNTAGAALNIDGLGGVAKIAGKPLAAAGDALYNSGVKSADASKSSFLQDLITPKQTPTVKADLFGRSTEEGVLRNRVVQPNAQEKSTISTLKELPVSSSNSLSKNYNIIKDANRAEGTSLNEALTKSGVTYNPATVTQNLDASLASQLQDPLIVGDAEKSVSRIYDKAKAIIANNPATASGLLKSRQEFDAWALSKKAKVFDANSNAFSEGVSAIRNELNSHLDSIAPNEAVKASLKKQSAMFNAMDAIKSKGGSEAPNLIARTGDKIANAIPGKGGLAKTAVATAATGLGVAAPAVAGGALAAYGGYKALSSPITRKALGSILGATDELGPLSLTNAATIPASALMNYGRK